MFPEVWQRVVGGFYHSAEGVLSGFARYAIIGKTYPAIIAQGDASVSGVIYFEVDDYDTAALDAFEGGDYQRIRVTGQVAQADVQSAETYIYANVSKLTNEPWRPEAFQLQRFLESYCRIPPNQ